MNNRVKATLKKEKKKGNCGFSRGKTTMPANNQSTRNDQVLVLQGDVGNTATHNLIENSGDSRSSWQHGSPIYGGRNHVMSTALKAINTPSSRLPYLDRIQTLFGAHDLTDARAHIGGIAGSTARDFDAMAYTTGNHVVFQGAPDLATAAHEAAHIVQQRAGLSPSEATGVSGEKYERQADDVAKRVVQGRAVADLMPPQPNDQSNSMLLAPTSQALPIQRRITGMERRRQDARPFVIRFRITRPESREALLTAIREDLVGRLSTVVRTPILARIDTGVLNEELDHLLSQTGGQDQIRFELRIFWSDSRTVETIWLRSEYTEQWLRSQSRRPTRATETPLREEESESSAPLEEQLGVLQRHVELTRGLVRLSRLTPGRLERIQRRRVEGAQHAHTLRQAATFVEFHNSDFSQAGALGRGRDDWEQVERGSPECTRFISFSDGDSQGRWELNPPIPDISDSEEAQAFVEGFNEYLEAAASVERSLGPIVGRTQEALGALGTARVSRGVTVAPGRSGSPPVPPRGRGSGGGGSGEPPRPSRRRLVRRPRQLRSADESIRLYRIHLEESLGVSRPARAVPHPGTIRYRVSPSRRTHILEGDPGRPGSGHGPNRGNTRGAFPDTWTDDQAIAAIERVANSPNSIWRQSTGPGYPTAPSTRGGPAPGSPTLTSRRTPVSFEVRGRDHGLDIVVIVQPGPGGRGIVTGYVR